MIPPPASPKVTVAMLGARRHYAVPRLLHEAGLLDRFFTDSYIGNKPLLRAVLRGLPGPLASANVQRWLGRDEPRLPAGKVTSFETLGLRYALARRRARSREDMQAVFADTGRRFNEAVIRHLPPNPDIVWGFNTASLELFAEAKRRGAVCVLEQTSLPRHLARGILADQVAVWGGWQQGIAVSSSDYVKSDNEEMEWNVADWIVAGSNFVRDGLITSGVSPKKVIVIPYGVDITTFTPKRSINAPRKRLRVLFVGEVGLNKGVPWLLRALRSLGPDLVQARLAGRVSLDHKKLEPYLDVAEFLGAVPRVKMPDLYRWADVFVLPSNAEGSAAASYEALLSGLPLVVTPNTGTIIRGGDAGFVVPPGDADAIANALLRYHDDPALLAEHRAGAIALRDFASTERYGRDLADMIRRI